ncbi:hypothetical protein BBJ28_00007319 [Nothophytophthora sp. Chile5]|nr:hypothetical protein BBJ28_00007319 [Nothophytophthora sp. Chile5]
MNYKTDIAFLLNPSVRAPTASMPTCQTPERVANDAPMTPPMSLFLSLSPVVRSPEPATTAFSPSRKMMASCLTPREKRFSNLRCYGSDKTRLPLLSLAAMYAASSSSSTSSNASNTPSCTSEDGEEDQTTSSPTPSTPSTASTTSTTQGKTRVRKTHTPPCQVEGCKNLAVSRGCCVRHGGGSRCNVAGCCKRAKLYQRCFQHGGFKTCTEPGCTKKAKRYGHCWSHGGGRICEVPECTKVSTQGGLCWAHGGGNRCKLEGCSRRSYQKYGYYCVHHAKLSSESAADSVEASS